mgnify:CR=1 FL=1
MLEILEHRLQSVMELDSYSVNGSYLVSSVYFDDYRDSCCFENEMGIGERHHYRIRIYNYNYSLIKLEKKIKNDGKCYTRSSTLDHASYTIFFTGDVA